VRGGVSVFVLVYNPHPFTRIGGNEPGDELTEIHFLGYELTEIHFEG
jgi:hypothetical protein